MKLNTIKLLTYIIKISPTQLLERLVQMRLSQMELKAARHGKNNNKEKKWKKGNSKVQMAWNELS